jgi:hypothetical protein
MRYVSPYMVAVVVPAALKAAACTVRAGYSSAMYIFGDVLAASEGMDRTRRVYEAYYRCTTGKI